MIDISKNFEGLMEYPEEFQKKCLTLYPDNKEIIDLLSKKSYLLYDKLKKLVPNEITDEEIFEASKAKNFDEIAKKNTDRKEKMQLIEDFNKLYDDQYLSKGSYIDESGLVCYCSYNKIGNVTKDGEKVKIMSPSINETEIKERNYRRKNGAEEAGKFYTI